MLLLLISSLNTQIDLLGPLIDVLGPWFRVNKFAGLLLILTAADMIGGVLLAIRLKKLDSSVAREGITRKAGMLLYVLVGKALQIVVMPGLPVSEMIAIYYCGSEGFSLVEKAGRLGAPLPLWLKQVFVKLREVGMRGPEGIIGDDR